MISPPVGVDDEVGDEIRPRRLDQDVGPFFRAAAALGVANDPAHGVAGGDRPEPTSCSPGSSAMSVISPGAA
jgi:hypothetical protein